MDLLFSHDASEIPILFRDPYALTSQIGFVIFSIMLIVAILHQNFVAIQDQSSYAGLFIRIVLVMGLMVLYESFFLWIVHSMDLLGNAIYPHEEFAEVIQVVFNQVVGKKDLGIFVNVNRIIMVGINYLTYLAAMVTLGLLSWLRYIFLALLFVLGPIVIPVGVYQSTSQGISFFLRSLIGIALWPVVLAILMKVISVMNLVAVYLPSETNDLSVLAANTLFVLLFISVPLIANMITSGGSISALGSGIIGITTALVTRVGMQKWLYASRGSNGLGSLLGTKLDAIANQLKTNQQGGGPSANAGSSASNPGGSGTSYK